MVTGVDIVKEQIRIAAGEQLAYAQDDITRERCAIECRSSAEDVFKNFLPCPGTINELRLPHGMGLRIDEGIYEGYKVSFHYDSLLLKLMAWGKTREEAISRMKRALNEMRVEGVQTTIPLHKIMLDDVFFNSGKYTTDFLAKEDIVKKVRDQSNKNKPITT